MLFEEDDALPNSVAQELRHLIVRGALLPGQHLGQTELANRFGRSKVPIREALKHLSTEGFLVHDRNRGYFVSPLDYGEAAQLYKLRRWLEADLLETTRWPTEAEIAGFRKQFDKVESIDQIKQFDQWSRALEMLRYSIFDLSPQKLLLREAIRAWRLTDRYRSLFPRYVGESPERALIDALEQQDRAALLTSYHAARDEVESLLVEAIENEHQKETAAAS
jgi:DNA-binding GntR family transcriptional regulator